MPRPKGQCKFNLAWLTLNKYKNWVDRDSSGDVQLAYCKVCVKTIKIGAAGKHNLDSHMLGETQLVVSQAHVFCAICIGYGTLYVMIWPSGMNE